MVMWYIRSGILSVFFAACAFMAGTELPAWVSLCVALPVTVANNKGKRERTIDLDDRQYAILKRLIETYIPHNEVWAYGSRVSWKASEHSDLDLVVFGSDSSTLADFREALTESDMVNSVDVMDWETIPDDFKENIKRNYAVVHKNILPVGWEVIKLGEVSDITGGGTPSTKTPEYWNGDILWITPRDLSALSERFVLQSERKITKAGLSSSNARMLPKGTVILSTRAPVGYLAIASNELCTNQGCKGLTVKKGGEIDNVFLYYLLLNNVGYLQAQSSGSVFGELTGSTLRALSFNVPPFEEQKKIAETLSSLDDKIALLRRQNKTLEDMAQVLFRKWFIENAEKDWEKGKLESVVSILNGFAFKGTDFIDGGCCGIVTIKNVQNGFIDSANFNTINTPPPNMPDYCLLKEGDILLSLTGNVGRCCLVTGKNLLLNQRVAVLKPKTENKRAFVYFLMRRPSMQKKLESMARGSAQLNLSPIETSEMEMQIPSDHALGQFDKTAGLFYQRILEINNQIRSLEEMRDFLLPKLMSGSVRVQS